MKRKVGFKKLKACGIGIIFGTSLYHLFLNDQQKSNVYGFYRSIKNSIFAGKTVFICIMDYYRNLPNYSIENEEFYEIEKSKIHTRVAQRILQLSEYNRGIYLKAGQYIGNLERIMPKEFTNVLKVLQDSGPSLEYNQIKVVLETDLNLPISHIFSEFNKNSIAAASLAQVHYAKLKNGKEVAVKLQFPFLKTQTIYDLEVIKNILKICNKFLKWNNYKDINLLKLFNTFQRTLIQELDFKQEADNAIKSKELFKNDNNVYIPTIYKEYSSSRMITMEFIKDAAKINNVEEIKKMDLIPLECASILIDTFGKMIFLFGHIHCDAHPGNILIRKHPNNSNKPQLVLLDHGIYRTISKDFRQKFSLLWKSLIELNNKKVMELAKELEISEFAHYLPILFLFRTANSKKAIGDTFTKEEKTYLKEIINFQEINYLLQALPEDLMFILRASNLIAIHNATLGGKTRTRLKRFTEFALENLYQNGFWLTLMKYWIFLKIFIFERFHHIYIKLF